MSTDVFDDAGLTVTRYCGPDDEGLGAGAHRLRWQVNVAGKFVQLTHTQLVVLSVALGNIARNLDWGVK